MSSVLRSYLQPAHRRVAGLLPPAARRRYLFLAGHRQLPDLRDPRTFSEKVNWRIHSRARKLLVVEEAIGGGEPLDDYKFFVFHGQVAAIQVDRGRFTAGHTRTFYTRDWEPLPVQVVAPGGPPAPAPAELAGMLRAAEVLGRSFDFMRVDLYCTGGQVWFGELTPYPGGGVLPFEPPSFDAWLGARWTLPASPRPVAGAAPVLRPVRASQLPLPRSGAAPLEPGTTSAPSLQG
ncbi:ATP-grasp fold amidoligase family protein [Blastococcus sp. KM273128]|uniref:ATP-grasp fold amidoligase family protein n=1 Tax=Blastococcus sp. KM273128 TaxID=2570314 RepID=UPI001F453279|nr:ATP-grasp fold amidoligase family protein [Blastococcus sp. KM273128]